MKYTLNITQEMIDFGTQRDCVQCPIARAGVAAGMFNVWVTPTTIRWFVNQHHSEKVNPMRRFCLPEIALQFIRDYDDGKTTQPFNFEVEVP